MNDIRREAAKRLGAKFTTCHQCFVRFVVDQEEMIAVHESAIDDFDMDGAMVSLCCSHRCASVMAAAFRASGKTALIWRSGKCGGTVMPDEAP